MTWDYFELVLGGFPAVCVCLNCAMSWEALVFELSTFNLFRSLISKDSESDN